MIDVFHVECGQVAFRLTEPLGVGTSLKRTSVLLNSGRTPNAGEGIRCGNCGCYTSAPTRINDDTYYVVTQGRVTGDVARRQYARSE